MPVLDDARFNVYYWDEEWNELDDLRVEDATLGEAVQELATWNARFQSLAPLTKHHDLEFSRVKSITVEVTNGVEA